MSRPNMRCLKQRCAIRSATVRSVWHYRRGEGEREGGGERGREREEEREGGRERERGRERKLSIIYRRLDEVDKAASVFARDEDGRTGLHHAARLGEISIFLCIDV